MPKKSFVLLLVLALAIQACAPGMPTPDLDTINTAIAQTLSAATQTAGIPVKGEETPTETITATPVIAASPTLMPATAVPTDTPIPAQSATPVLTPGVTQVYVSVPTNCRLGPSVSYERVGGLQLGQVATVVGRNASGDYWIIRNPSRASETCWLWGQYATVVGDTSVLPVFSPPPLPTPQPGFTASFDSLESCTETNSWWPDIALDNTGGISFQSSFTTVTDTVTGVVLTLYQNNFVDRDGCNVQENQGSLDPADILILSLPAFNYNPAGHPIRARITLCSNPNQSGTCLTENFNFTP